MSVSVSVNVNWYLAVASERKSVRLNESGSEISKFGNENVSD